MKNLLLTKLPQSLEINGQRYQIYTDFRKWLYLNELLLSNPTPEMILETVESLFVKEIPVDGEKTFKQISWFMQCGKEAKKENSSQKVVFSYSYDSDYIIAAFQEFYNIDLLKVRYMHWWKFNLLLGTLSSECELKERVRIRTIDPSKIKNTKERRRIRKLQAMVALPQKELSDEEIASAF